MADRDIAFFLWQEELCHEMVWPIAENGGGVCGVCVCMCVRMYFVYMMRGRRQRYGRYGHGRTGF